MDLQRPDWGGPWSDKSLVALQEVSILLTITESPPSPNGVKSPSTDSCWVTGYVFFFSRSWSEPLIILILNSRRLFLSPVHRELYVCYQDGVAQDILDLAFHLAFGSVL